MTANIPELIHVIEEADEVSCNGGGGALGHPMVFYSFGLKRSVRCGYCDRQFIKDNANS